MTRQGPLQETPAANDFENVATTMAKHARSTRQDVVGTVQRLRVRLPTRLLVPLLVMHLEEVI